MIYDDEQMILATLPAEQKSLRIYPIGDLHLGSPQFDWDKWTTWKEMVAEDEFGKIVIIGDMVDNGVLGSKTNQFKAKMTQQEQRDKLIEMFSPLSDKILGATSGNHENRLVKYGGSCPLYDMMLINRIDDKYRENFAGLKISLGKKNHTRQFTYSIALLHGASKTKTETFTYSVDNVDIVVSGHNHQTGCSFPAKYSLNLFTNKVVTKGYVYITVAPFLKFVGYSVRNAYKPFDNKRIPILELSGTEKDVKVIWR